MRGRGHDLDHDSGFRPRGDRVERDDHDLLGRAAAAGRTDVLGPAGLLGLQRTIGNAAVGPLVDEERSPVHDVVSSGGGVPLDRDVRADMEGRFGGQDFGDVRVHTSAAADTSARSVNAQAYTVGPNIVFQRDRYDPSSDAGRHMLAHELTHVVQQRSGPVDGTDAGGGVRVSDPGDRFEREAVANADRLMSAPAVPTAPAAVQRCDDGAPQAGSPVQREELPEEDETAQTFVQRQDDEEEEPTTA